MSITPLHPSFEDARSLSWIVHTSVDDAKTTIANASKEQCEAALTYLQTKNKHHKTRIKMIQARLKRLSKV